MSKRNDSSVPLLKTCQTCFHAKIRCDKTQDSGLCDRCLRLGKTCIFAQARRRNAGRNNRAEKREGGSHAPSRSPSIQPTTVSSDGWGSPLSSLISRSGLDAEGVFNPFTRGLLSFERGQELLDIFRTRMTPYFPFIVIPDNVTIQELVSDKPSLCLAIMGASSNGDVKLQRMLIAHFNEIVTMRMIRGTFTTIELLQGLLVHVAWAHYHPRPRRVSQYLHLATSIISDMRLDRPRKHHLWTVDASKNDGDLDWGVDEKRAFAGAYYLSSSSAVLLQKSRHFNYTPYVFDCCQQLSNQGEQPTDKYLPYIIHLQKLTEEVDDSVARAQIPQSSHRIPAELQAIRDKYMYAKQTLPFPLSDSPTILLQLNVLDLLLSQSSPDGSPFGLSKFQNLERTGEDQSRLLDWLSQSISAARALISVVLVLPHGQEGALPNIGWIMLYCALSLAVRLDLVAVHASISQTAHHLRRILDMPHTLRQIVLRLEAATGPDVDVDGDRDGFYHLARRARGLEDWYQQHCKQAEMSQKGNMFTPADSSASNPPPSTGLTPAEYMNSSSSVPSIEVTAEPDDMWSSALMGDFSSEFELNNALFAEPFEWFSGHQYQ
ncbi:Fc.00g079700.m01.CDS01 [Cosmosporella sp. VM-42]